MKYRNRLQCFTNLEDDDLNLFYNEEDNEKYTKPSENLNHILNYNYFINNNIDNNIKNTNNNINDNINDNINNNINDNINDNINNNINNKKRNRRPRFITTSEFIEDTEISYIDLSRLSRFRLDDIFYILNHNFQQNYVITDEKGLIKYVNYGWCNLCQYNLDEVKDKTLKILQGEETNRNTLSKFEKELKSNNKANMIILNYKKNQNKFWNKVKVYTIQNNIDNLYYYICEIKEINLKMFK